MLTDPPFTLMSLTSGESGRMPAVMSSTALLVLLCLASLPDDAFYENGGDRLK